MPAGHLTSATAEVGDRASGFVFIGLAAVLGTWWWTRRRRPRTTAAFALAVTVTFLGSVVLGSGPASGQLPGPYQVSADARSVDADNIAAATWEATGLPKDSVVYGDRTSGLLAAADGGQQTVLHVSTNLDVSQLLLAPTFTSVDVAPDREGQAGLPHRRRAALLAGCRTSSSTSRAASTAGRTGPTPVSAAALAKFAAVPGVTRVYDNGSIEIYDVRGLR